MIIESDKIRIIVADDEPITRMDISGMLTESGFLVVGEAVDGFDAVELCRTLLPDIVLMDVRMPIFDGLSAAETIIEEKLCDCVILLTAFSDQNLVDRAVRTGIAGYLVKPISQGALLAAISVAIAQTERVTDANKQVESLQNKMLEDKMIYKAQQILARQENCTEREAYQKMRSAAMNKRVSIAQIAEGLIRQAKRTDVIVAAKKVLCRSRGMSDSRAYQYLKHEAELRRCSLEEQCRRVMCQSKLEGSDCDN